MNQTDRDSLTDLLHQNNDKFQPLSHEIHWTAEDSECLDNIAGSNISNNEYIGVRPFCFISVSAGRS